MSLREQGSDAARISLAPDDTGSNTRGGRPAEHLTSASRRRGSRVGSGVSNPVAEQPAQFSSSTVKLRRHRSSRSIHNRPNLLVTEPLDIGVEHHVAKLPRQNLHPGPHHVV